MPISPVLERQTTYPFVRLNEAARASSSAGRRADRLRHGRPARADRSADPRGARRRRSASGWAIPPPSGCRSSARRSPPGPARRFGVELDPDTEVIPTLGSKEAIFSFAQIAVDSSAGRTSVAFTEPGLSGLRARRALRRTRSRSRCRCARSNGFLPDLDAIDAETWGRLAVFWVNYPNNPTCAMAPLAFYERLAELAREHDFVLASDEAYTELWFDEPPASALQLADRTNVVVFNTLSKRSLDDGLPQRLRGRRPGAVAALKAFRPTVGTAPQEFVQRASVVAWGDEEHVERTRELYARKRALFLDLFARKGIRVAGSEATMYLWVAVPAGESSEAFAERLLEHGVLVAPGSYLGAGRRGLRPARARPVRGGVRPRRRDPRGGAVKPELVGGDRRRARPRRAPRRLARSTATGSSTSRRRRRSSSTSGCARSSRSRSARSRSRTRSRSRATRRTACGSCRRGSRATARSSPRASC